MNFHWQLRAWLKKFKTKDQIQKRNITLGTIIGEIVCQIKENWKINGDWKSICITKNPSRMKNELNFKVDIGTW